ncbi:hypothetical protein HY68_01390 [Streptomyces sp. AcH 505]|uniref:hypothetical protein n=1 Tax=Streptomyces sp. AcH 505 TaxID=352211 RepID=UPI00059213BA|nr:hypothetical protein HY68_01390 [Streptomyces sp. AcH 505]
MNATRAEITALLRQGRSNTAISRELHCDKKRVRELRRLHNIPHAPLQPLTLKEKWATFTKPLPGGHVEWTGSRQKGSGTPLLRYKQAIYGAAAVAFRIHHGRPPVGQAYADCGHHQCVAPNHVDDTITRGQLREAVRHVNGLPPRPALCIRDHDQAEHGRFEADGRAYCQQCKRERKTAGRQADAEVGS